GPLQWEEIIGPLGPQDTIVNDFEPVVFAHHPELCELKHLLLDSGARVAMLSGSGSGIFGLFDSEKKRDSAVKALDAGDDFRLVCAHFIDQAYRIIE
ncbi:MAG TPA: hypothetical protein VJ417_16890, partial [Candidatus Glassbacteria bacterium]|nr:hypothetical protein [Candidatus Glassbacteria bacterium]